MTAIREPVPLPDEFVLVFEGRTVKHHQGYRSRKCPHCTYLQAVVYGQSMTAQTHVCYRDGVKHVVIWKTL